MKAKFIQQMGENKEKITTTTNNKKQLVKYKPNMTNQYENCT